MVDLNWNLKKKQIFFYEDIIEIFGMKLSKYKPFNQNLQKIISHAFNQYLRNKSRSVFKYIYDKEEYHLDLSKKIQYNNKSPNEIIKILIVLCEKDDFQDFISSCEESYFFTQNYILGKDQIFDGNRKDDLPLILFDKNLQKSFRIGNQKYQDKKVEDNKYAKFTYEGKIFNLNYEKMKFYFWERPLDNYQILLLNRDSFIDSEKYNNKIKEIMKSNSTISQINKFNYTHLENKILEISGVQIADSIIIANELSSSSNLNKIKSIQIKDNDLNRIHNNPGEIFRSSYFNTGLSFDTSIQSIKNFSVNNNMNKD